MLHKTALASLSFVALQACTPTQGYDGPPRPPHETAFMASYSHESVERDGFYVDGQEVSYFGPGISVLPGLHNVELSFSEKSHTCPDDYLTNPSCPQTWHCEGEVEAVAGETIRFRLVPGGVWAFRNDSDQPFSPLSCELSPF